MGLDQYLNKVVVKQQTEEVKYWRKNNQLQGWFERYCGQENCVPTKLNKYNIEVLEQLIDDIKARNLEKTQGFFYGNYELEDEEWEGMLKVFSEARQDIIDNDTEYEYNCWY